MKKFEKASQVANVVYYLKAADVPRSANRALINDLFNGEPPYSEREAEENHCNTNVNFLDAARIAHDARNTFTNAFLKPGNFFTVSLDSGPPSKRSTWSRIITKNINRLMKQSKPYMDTLKAEFAQTVLHGVGPSAWEDKWKWCPDPVAMDDFLVPSRTKVSLENLDYFAIFKQFTPAKLYKLTHGKKLDPGWNMKLVNQLLKKYASEYLTNTYNDINITPEKLSETLKSDLTWFDNEAIPTINCWDFYYRNDDTEAEEWHRKMIVDYTTEGEMGQEFIYEPKAPFATNLNHILHVMFGDGSSVAPFRYHSVRGLGWLLYAVCHLQNRLRCKVNDKAFEDLMMWFRVSSPEDRERLDKIDLHHLGVIPDGLQILLNTERYNPNPTFIEQVLAQNNQTMSESSAQFRPELDNGTQKEMTAVEVMARMNNANALVGSMLTMSYNNQGFQYDEICRRFCQRPTLDKDAKEFQRKCREEGVPEEYLDSERWIIEPERVLGSGNKTLEIAQAKELMAARPLYDPEPQRQILHIFTEAMTDDPQLAAQLVPIDKKPVSDAVHDAQLAAGTLMMGMPVAIKTGMNHQEYIEALLGSMGAVIKRLQQQEQQQVPLDFKDLMGLQNIAAHIEQHIQILAQDKAEKQNVKRYSDLLGNFMNIVKAFMQHFVEAQQQAQQNGSNLPPEAKAKIQATMLTAQTKAKLDEAKTRQKLVHKDVAFKQRQAQDAQKHRMALGEQAQRVQADIAAKDVQTAADIKLKQAAVVSEPEGQE